MDVVFAGLSGLCDWEDQGNVGGLDVLAPRQTHRPLQTALAQSLTERSAGAVPRIGKHTAETHTGGDDAVDLRQGNLWLGPRCAVLDWNTGALQTHRITRPTLGNEET